ncbi:MAG: hypothetical protein HN341_07750 [Verrucomicrobia bacterium]|nr:hypothetical protein [Verrucomicrobiota bacterium]
MKVGYPGVFHTPYTSASFRIKPDIQAPATLSFRAVGGGSISINTKQVAVFTASDTVHTVSLDPHTRIDELRVYIKADDAPPALLVEDAALSTTNGLWEWKAVEESWQKASTFWQNNTGVPPHLLDDPAIVLKPKPADNGLLDFGCELFGTVVIKSGDKPTISVGESKAEALNTNAKDFEQSLEMVRSDDGTWRSKSPLTFRYLLTEKKHADAVHCLAIFRPATYHGAFACSDPKLTQVWMTSAYTLRVCMHDFLLDGMKRDRLPWTGDLAMSMLANAYTFSDPEIVRRSLVAIGRAGIKQKDINGIVDYSLWWVISQDHYQLYFADAKHLKQEWPRIKEVLDDLAKRCDDSGFLRPGRSWLFIDWVEQPKWTALQILWWWAQESGVRLAERMKDTETKEALQISSAKLKAALLSKCWSSQKSFWLPGITPKDRRYCTKHPNFLAVISGMATEGQYDGITKALKSESVPPVGTPYMAGFETMAVARLGDTQFMLDFVRRYWGGMLEQGATTFWEAYDPKQSGTQHYEFYGRPYGKSLCHAWSAGPAAFLPSEIVGLRPIEDGWKRFSIAPNLGDLTWVSIATPTLFGTISVDIDQNTIQVKIPEGTTLDYQGQSYPGPKHLTLSIKEWFLSS